MRVLRRPPYVVARIPLLVIGVLLLAGILITLPPLPRIDIPIPPLPPLPLPLIFYKLGGRPRPLLEGVSS